MRHSFFLSSLGLLCLLEGANASSQESPQKEVVSKPPEVVSAEERGLLMERERGLLHKGVPLDISGIEEGDNDFRARTPLLQQSTGEITRVDRDENRRRRLAMYEGRKSFSTPLAVVSSAPVSRSAPAVVAPAEVSGEPATNDEPGSLTKWLFSLIGAAFAGAAVLWRSSRT